MYTGFTISLSRANQLIPFSCFSNFNSVITAVLAKRSTPQPLVRETRVRVLMMDDFHSAQEAYNSFTKSVTSSGQLQ